MTFHPRNSMSRSHVELRAEMNVLVVLNTCQHPLDPNPQIRAQAGAVVGAQSAAGRAPADPCRRFAPENRRGFTFTERYFCMSALLVESEREARRRYLPLRGPGGRTVDSRDSAGASIFRIVDLKAIRRSIRCSTTRTITADRYSAQDTIREQGNIYLTTGTRLMSTAGNVLLTIVADTCGRHDTLGGACADESNMVRYAIEKRYMHACRQSFLKAIVEWEHGMDKRDITSNINFFMNVPVTPEGGLTFEDGSLRRPGSTSRCAPRWMCSR